MTNPTEHRLGIYREGDTVSHKVARELRALPAARDWNFHPLLDESGFVLRWKGLRA